MFCAELGIDFRNTLSRICEVLRWGLSSGYEIYGYEMVKVNQGFTRDKHGKTNGPITISLPGTDPLGGMDEVTYSTSLPRAHPSASSVCFISSAVKAVKASTQAFPSYFVNV